MNELKSSIIKFYIVFFLICVAFVLSATSFASTSKYTDVLDDLKADENFNISDYEEIKDDYSLNVIHIAYSENDELFVYVYQPSSNYKFITASSINFADKIEDSKFTNYNNYKLTLLNNNGLFSKYLVNDYKVSTLEGTHYYYITSIYRPFDTSIDEALEDDNTLNEKANEVAQQWVINKTNDTISYSYSYKEVVDITYQHLGFIRYKQNSNLTGKNHSGVDRHYMAFNCEKKIEDLLEIEIEFDYHYKFESLNYEYDGEERVEITNQMEGTTDHDFWLDLTWNDYTWDSIQKTTEFIEEMYGDENFINWNDEMYNAIKDTQWVVNFYETQYSINNVDGNDQVDITNVKVYRMKFISDGITYDLGVVADIQSGDTNPDKEIDLTYITTLMEKIMMIVSFIVLLVVLGYVFPFLNFILAMLKAVWKVITLPFKLIGRLFKRKKY